MTSGHQVANTYVDRAVGRAWVFLAIPVLSYFGKVCLQVKGQVYFKLSLGYLFFSLCGDKKRGRGQKWETDKFPRIHRLLRTSLLSDSENCLPGSRKAPEVYLVLLSSWQNKRQLALRRKPTLINRVKGLILSKCAAEFANKTTYLL